MKARPLGGVARRPDLSAVGLHCGSGDGETDARAADGAGMGLVCPVKAVEQPVRVCVQRRVYGIGDGELRPFAAAPGGQPDAAVLSSPSADSLIIFSYPSRIRMFKTEYADNRLSLRKLKYSRCTLCLA